MEFDSPDSPEVAKEFPGLYRADGLVDVMSDPAEYDEDIDKKKKKEKKDSKKDKGYAALAGESSHDEDDPGATAADPKSPGKKNLIKSFKLSGKKKDKDKDKDKDGKKSEKDKKSEKEKAKKYAELVERKSADKEMVTPVRIPFSAERHRSSVPAAFMPSAMTPKSSGSGVKSDAGESSAEKSSVSALNAFLNAPAPMFLQKKKDKDKDKEHRKEKEAKEGKKDKENKKDKESKEHKKDKESKKDKDKKEHKEKKDHASSVSKVKLKLMRSKNSLEDPHELHVSVSHQFPEDPESLAKEIRKYEHLLEQNHLQIKSSKKVSKKQEEQLWELQRTLTQLKRKLRSINALSSASANFSLHHHHNTNSSTKVEVRDSVLPSNLPSNSIPPPSSSMPEGNVQQKTLSTMKPNGLVNEDLQLDFTLKSPDAIIIPVPVPSTVHSSLHAQIESESPANEETIPVEVLTSELSINPSDEQIAMRRESRPLSEKISARRSLDFSEVVDKNNFEPILTNVNDAVSISNDAIGPLSRKGSKDGMISDIGVQAFKIESPLEREKVEVRVLVHNESREDSSSGAEEDPDETDLPALSSRQEENIGTVVDDANAMIGSMHEELEAAALVFRQRKFSEDGKGHITLVKRHDGTNQHLITKISKSEPTFGDQGNESSDIELIREDEDQMDNFTEDIIPELMSLPIFETEEYYIFENEQLALFNNKIQEDIKMEESFFDELEELKKSEECINESDIPDDSEPESSDVEHLMAIWQAEKSENEALHENVNRLRQLVAMSRLEEFKLETRLRYLEDKVIPISPITITTPLQANDDE